MCTCCCLVSFASVDDADVDDDDDDPSCPIYIAANLPRFSGIFPVLTLYLGFLVSVVVFRFLKKK